MLHCCCSDFRPCYEALKVAGFEVSLPVKGKEVLMALTVTEVEDLSILLSKSRKKFGAGAVERLERAFTIGSSSDPLPIPEESYQRGATFLFPGLSSRPWLEPGDFRTVDRLERASGKIKDELRYALHERRGFQQYIRTAADQPTDPIFDVPKEWKALYLKKARECFPENRVRCPETASIIADNPEVADMVIFSALDPGGHIAPHCASYNWIVTAHLGLSVPENCGLRVGSETRTWEEGKCLVFDVSFEHEAWNRGDHTRFVLLVNLWHPELTSIEIEVLEQAVLVIQRQEKVDYLEAVKQEKEQLQGKKWWA
jgi:aspartyl/asparaginyl beta-hydroxylase (cupin superfamily)